MNRLVNRKLLVSVFNAQEAREAVLGGGRIIDSEDPKSALGNIKPRHIMEVSDAVLDFTRDLEVQLSTNIGEDQLLFRRSETGEAIEKSPYEIAGKASQAAIGVACSMGTRVHPVNLVKVGVDGMTVDMVSEVLQEVVLTLKRTEQFSHTQVMSVLFGQDLVKWAARRSIPAVRRQLVELREYYPSQQADPLSFNLQDFAAGTLRDATGNPLFSPGATPTLDELIAAGALPAGTDSPFVRVNELFAHSTYFPEAKGATKTTTAVIEAMVDVTADAGANSIMIDTSILTKVSNICLVDTATEGFVDINSFVGEAPLGLTGILSLDELRFFVEYCHYRGIAANIAGSVESFHAQQLWASIPELDQVSTRSSASAVVRDPANPNLVGEDTRQRRVIKRQLVRGLAAPEHGGVLNLPAALRDSADAQLRVEALVAVLTESRAKLNQPPLEVFYVDRDGNAV